MLLLVKQAELSNIINDVQTSILSSKRRILQRPDHWVVAVYNKLNAELWSWHDSLPGEMRWNKWSSNLEVVDPSLASLQYVSYAISSLLELTPSSRNHSMLYHTTRIALNRPLLARSSQKRSAPHMLTEVVTQAFQLCEASVETIVGIARRLNAQHSLQSAPLTCVHGVIIAVDAALAMSSWTGPEREDRESPRSPGKDTTLSMLETALADLSSAWTIAQDAHTGLRTWLDQRSGPQEGDVYGSGRRSVGSDGTPSTLASTSVGTVSATMPSSDTFDLDFSAPGTLAIIPDAATQFPYGNLPLGLRSPPSTTAVAPYNLFTSGEVLDPSIFDFEIPHDLCYGPEDDHGGNVY
jgi:hypothetical protein